VMQYHESLLGDFSGVLLVDSHSNAFLNITLIEAMGSIHGTVSSSNYTQVNSTPIINYIIHGRLIFSRGGQPF
jgi:hypothetical protein